MPSITSLANDFVGILNNIDSDHEEANQAANALIGAAATADPIARDDALSIVASALTNDSPVRGGMAAIVGGAIVENGGTAAMLARPLIARLPDVLGLAADFLAMVEEATPPRTDDEDDSEDEDDPGDGLTVYTEGRPVPRAISDPIAQEHRREASVFFNLSMWCLPTIACLSTSADLRREAATPELLSLCEVLEESGDNCGFLYTMLQVLDKEPLMVLHPESRLGFECRMSGVSRNFQLHTLLADALIRDPEPSPVTKKPGLLGRLFGGSASEPAPVPAGNWLTGPRPSPALVAVVKGTGPQQIKEPSHGVWNLYNWRALNAQGHLPDSANKRETWIWNEGVPADIEKFEGTRVVLLGPETYKRSWSSNRDFGLMKASVEVVRPLTAAEVDDWLRRMSAAAG